MHSEIVQYKVVEINQLSENISEIYLASTQSKLVFLPGQYVYVYFSPDKQLPYSIASSPTNEKIRLLIFHGVDNQNINFFKDNLEKPIKLSRAQGIAYFRNTQNPLFLMSKGLGIAPIISILEYLAYIKCSNKIFLYYIVSNSKELVMDNYFQNFLKQSQLNLHYSPEVLPMTQDCEYLYESIVNAHPDLLDFDFYVYGSNYFVTKTYYSLLPEGLPHGSNKFHTDVKLLIEQSTPATTRSAL